jgi:hypothetical protein
MCFRKGPCDKLERMPKHAKQYITRLNFTGYAEDALDGSSDAIVKDWSKYISTTLPSIMHMRLHIDIDSVTADTCSDASAEDWRDAYAHVFKLPSLKSVAVEIDVFGSTFLPIAATIEEGLRQSVSSFGKVLTSVRTLNNKAEEDYSA